MLCRAKLSSVSQVGLDAATDSVLFFLTGGVSFCSGVDRARGSFGEPKVTPPFLVYTLSDVTSQFGATWTNVQTTRMALVILKYESPLEKKRVMTSSKSTYNSCPSPPYRHNRRSRRRKADQ